MVSILVTADHALAAAYSRNGGCVMGVVETEDPSQAIFDEGDAVVMTYEAISEPFLRMIACHRYHLPYTIAVTRRLRIRESIPEDYEAIHSMLRSCPKDVFSDGLTADEIGDRVRFVRYAATAYAFFGYGFWTVVLKNSPAGAGREEVIGWCGLFPSSAGRGHLENASSVSGSSDHDRPEAETSSYAIELGYLIREDVRGQGYALEACRAICEYAGREIGAKGLLLQVPAGNKASRALAETLGFRRIPGNGKVLRFELNLADKMIV